MHSFVKKFMEMKSLQEYIIPLKGMKSGMHEHMFFIDGTFFAHFPEAMLDACDLEVMVKMDKRPNMVLMQFEIGGYIVTQCDRCTAEIKLPISGSYPLIAKFGESEEDFEEEEDVITVHPDSPNVNVSKQLYDYISLSIPMIREYDCTTETPKPCDEKARKILERASEEESKANPIWDELKKKLS